MAPPATLPAALSRRTAGGSRAAVGLTGATLVLAVDGLHPHPALAAIGFAVIVATALAQLVRAGYALTVVEETVAALAAVPIVALGGPRVTILSLLWLCAVACGVVARGGRVHWVGRAILLASLAYAGLADGPAVEVLGLLIGAVALLLACGRLTRELNAMLERARFDADHDHLTATWSRSKLRAELQQRLDAGAAVRLLLVDLDDFGAVNKAQGHAAGDRLLVDAVARVGGALPPGAHLGRLGGDEFAVVCPDDARGVDGDRLLRALDAGEVPIRASIGVAHAPEDGDDVDAVLRAADVALRVAKRHGKHQVVVYDAASLTDDSAMGARGALMRLIAGDGLAVVVQPIVDVHNGGVHAYEALARFRTRGTESPLHWFALADEFGLRAELEIACLRAALRLFPQRPAGTRMTVNLSAPLLHDRRVGALLDAAGDLDGLIVEVTEDSLVREQAGLLLALGPLLERGVVFAVDDVGAGYSGLGQLTALRPALVKLDRGLVAGIDRSPHQAALVEAFVGYARRTGGEVVAEGIETFGELDTVRALGVRLVQGFALGRPGEPWPTAVHDPAVA